MNNFIIISCVLILLGGNCKAQNQSINGRVTTSTGAPLPEVKVELSTSIGAQGEVIHSETDDNGYFRIQVTLENIRIALREGATWILSAKKRGYTPETRNVAITENIVDPGTVNFQLEANPYRENYLIVDACGIKEKDLVTIYLFDLKPINPENDITVILDNLTYKVKREIINHLETYDLSGGLKLEIIRCSGLDVKNEQYAIHYGNRIKASGVIWGYSQTQDSIETFISLTHLEDSLNGLTGMTSISYSNNLADILDISQPVSTDYLAFSSYILGKVHLIQGNITYAMRCFQNAKSLRSLPDEYQQSLSYLISHLESEGPYRDLRPIDK